MTEYAHKRMDRIERQLSGLSHNTAPTVPIYDLQSPVISNHLLQINNPDIDGFTPILYFIFPVPQNDVWQRITYRPDVYDATDHDWFTPYLVFKSYFDNQDYYGALGTGGNYIGGAGRCHNHSSDNWHVDAVNVGADPIGSQDLVSGVWTGNATILDFHMMYVGDIAPPANRWLLELYADDTLVASQQFDYTTDPEQSANPFIDIGGIIITNNYGDPAGSSYWDDISVGTTQGHSNMMAVNDFEGTPFGGFTEIDDGSGMVDSFAVVVDPV